MKSREQADILYNAKSYVQAIPLYRAAVEANPGDHYSWGQLVLSLGYANEHEAAIEAGKSALRSHPRSAWLWRQLGNELFKLDRLEEAERALDQSKRIDPEAEWLWRYSALLHKARKHPIFEAEALEELFVLDKVNGTDLNRLGIIHHDNKNYIKALEYYRASALMEASTSPYYNMGLVYNDPEVSQDADAADAYRRALLIDATYDKASTELKSTKAKLIPLAEQAHTQAVSLVRKDDFYRHYLNPFEVLQLDPEDEYNDVDPKVIQRAKKRLLQELDLNEGKVGWLEDQALEKSRVLTIDDELLDESKRTYHLTVARNILCFGYGICAPPITGETPQPKSQWTRPPATDAAVPSVLTIHPNPASTWVAFSHLLTGKVDRAFIRVRDTQGKEVHSVAIASSPAQSIWDTRGMAAGTYTVELHNSGSLVEAQRVVVRP